MKFWRLTVVWQKVAYGKRVMIAHKRKATKLMVGVANGPASALLNHMDDASETGLSWPGVPAQRSNSRMFPNITTMQSSAGDGGTSIVDARVYVYGVASVRLYQ